MTFLKNLLDKWFPVRDATEEIVEDPFTDSKDKLTPTERTLVEKFEEVISERPEDYLIPGQVVYTVTLTELVKYSMEVFRLGSTTERELMETIQQLAQKQSTQPPVVQGPIVQDPVIQHPCPKCAGD